MVSITPIYLGTAVFYDAYFTAFYYIHVGQCTEYTKTHGMSNKK